MNCIIHANIIGQADKLQSNTIIKVLLRSFSKKLKKNVKNGV
jgi:hypothetical protein